MSQDAWHCAKVRVQRRQHRGVRRGVISGQIGIVALPGGGGPHQTVERHAVAMVVLVQFEPDIVVAPTLIFDLRRAHFGAKRVRGPKPGGPVCSGVGQDNGAHWRKEIVEKLLRRKAVDSINAARRFRHGLLAGHGFHQPFGFCQRPFVFCGDSWRGGGRHRRRRGTGGAFRRLDHVGIGKFGQPQLCLMVGHRARTVGRQPAIIEFLPAIGGAFGLGACNVLLKCVARLRPLRKGRL